LECVYTYGSHNLLHTDPDMVHRSVIFKLYTSNCRPKFGKIFVRQLYQILTDFQNYFTVRIERKFETVLSLEIPPRLKCVATLPCEMSSVIKATIENKTTSVTTYFKKLTTGNNVFIVSVIV